MIVVHVIKLPGERRNIPKKVIFRAKIEAKNVPRMVHRVKVPFGYFVTPSFLSHYSVPTASSIVFLGMQEVE